MRHGFLSQVLSGQKSGTLPPFRQCLVEKSSSLHLSHSLKNNDTVISYPLSKPIIWFHFDLELNLDPCSELNISVSSYLASEPRSG